MTRAGWVQPGRKFPSALWGRPEGIGLFLFVALGAVAGTTLAAAEPQQGADFEKQVAPILRRHCLSCHNKEEKKGELSLATAQDLLDGGYIVPGDVESSGVFELLVPEPGEPRPAMPKTGKPLTQKEIDTLRRWVAAGAPWPRHVELTPLRGDASWWAYQVLWEGEPPVVPEAPPSWQKNPIDRFVYARLKAAGLKPNPPADRRTWLRRVTYDLTGLPPTPEELDAFLKDRSPQAYEKVVDRLLASPAYGEHWGRHWLDVVRFGESNGFERNIIINNLWPYRDYVIRSFNQDKPFNRFIMEQLAGDVLDPHNPEVAVGTAFLVCGPYDNVGNQDPVQAAIIRANTIDEIIRATGEAFLGTTMGCARCHEHKFDPIEQSDYYAWYATFAGVKHGDREIASPEQRRRREEKLRPLLAEKNRLQKQRTELIARVLARAEKKRQSYEATWTREPVSRYGTEERFPPVEARYVRLRVLAQDANPNARTGFRIDEFEVWTTGPQSRNVALLSAGATAQGASRTAEDFADAYTAPRAIDGDFGTRWIAAGPELVITLARPQRIHRVVFSSDRRRELPPTHGYTTFVCEYVIEVSLDGKRWATVANSRSRRPVHQRHRRKRLLDAEITPEERKQLQKLDAELARVQQAIAAVPPLPRWWVGRMQKAPGPFHVFAGGDPQKKADPVVPHSIAVLERTAGKYRLDASAPEGQRRLALARWIASDRNALTLRVLANRLWHYHFGRGIVATPSDFGMMGARPTHPKLLDWLAVQLRKNGWRLKPLHRLIVLSQTYRQSSAYREEAARVDGTTELLWRYPPRRLAAEEIRDTMLAASGVLDRRMGGPGFRLYRYLQDNVATYVPLDRPGPETYRRAVYHQNARAARVDVLSDFDCPDPAFAAPRRAQTTSPLQALTMMNHHFVLDLAEHWARRLKREAGAEPAAQVRRAFLLLLARDPDQPELQQAVRLVEQYGLRAFCRAMFNSNEMIYLD